MPLENGPQTAHTATGSIVAVTHKTVPIAVSMRTPWGAVELPPNSFAAIPGKGDDDVLFLGRKSWRCLYPLALEKLRPRAVPVKTGVETSSFLPARRVTVPPWSFQTDRVEQAPADVVVEPMVDRGIDRFMYPAGERDARESARKESVQQAVQPTQ